MNKWYLMMLIIIRRNQQSWVLTSNNSIKSDMTNIEIVIISSDTIQSKLKIIVFRLLLITNILTF